MPAYIPMGIPVDQINEQTRESGYLDDLITGMKAWTLTLALTSTFTYFSFPTAGLSYSLPWIWWPTFLIFLGFGLHGVFKANSESIKKFSLLSAAVSGISLAPFIHGVLHYHGAMPVLIGVIIVMGSLLFNLGELSLLRRKKGNVGLRQVMAMDSWLNFGLHLLLFAGLMISLASLAGVPMWSTLMLYHVSGAVLFHLYLKCDLAKAMFYADSPLISRINNSGGKQYTEAHAWLTASNICLDLVNMFIHVVQTVILFKSKSQQDKAFKPALKAIATLLAPLAIVALVLWYTKKPKPVIAKPQTGLDSSVSNAFASPPPQPVPDFDPTTGKPAPSAPPQEMKFDPNTGKSLDDDDSTSFDL
jgi:hypothetical protein